MKKPDSHHLVATLRRIDTPAPCAAADVLEQLLPAVVAIASGRSDNGRPLGGEEARNMCRTALIGCGYGWSEKGYAKEMP